MRPERCETCKFWDQDGRESGEDAGECHRYPPVFMDGNLAIDLQYKESDWEGHWPDTRNIDWCGEWKQKEGQP